MGHCGGGKGGDKGGGKGGCGCVPVYPWELQNAYAPQMDGQQRAPRPLKITYVCTYCNRTFNQISDKSCPGCGAHDFRKVVS